MAAASKDWHELRKMTISEMANRNGFFIPGWEDDPAIGFRSIPIIIVIRKLTARGSYRALLNRWCLIFRAPEQQYDQPQDKPTKYDQ
jgi:hypothetical protein